MFSLKRALSYSDVSMVPNFAKTKSKSEVNLYMQYDQLPTPFDAIPLINAPMDTVCSVELCRYLNSNDFIVTIHRFFKTVEEQIAFFEECDFEYPERVFIAVGSIYKWKDWVKTLVDFAGQMEVPFGILVDMANGGTIACVETVQYIRGRDSKINIMAGNVATRSSYDALADAGANMVRVGIGGGCLRGDTRILMANGTYKNIADISKGDRVINKNGNPVNVVNLINSGKKNISSVKPSVFHSPVGITRDHNVWQYDLSSYANSTFSSRGYLGLLSNKTPKWKQIGECDNRNIMLIPSEIRFDIPENIDDEELCESYGLGYIFGTFLGDGCSQTGSPYIPSRKRCQKQGSVTWYFGKNEIKIAEKLQSFIKQCLCENSKIVFMKNMIVVKLYRKKWADFFSTFGKKNEKHLPTNLMCNNKEYLRGIIDGLIDSDGHTEKTGRVSIYNTSKKVIELFGVCFKIVNGYFPNSSYRNSNSGGLEDCDVENCKTSFYSRSIKHPEKRINDEYQLVKITGIDDCGTCDTFDIEVDCPTHSFVANNCIVHNSICTTRLNTGFGVPVFTSVLACCEAKREGVYVIADGGIEHAGDMAKAMKVGADACMIGKLLAGTSMSGGEKLDDGTVVYNGAASRIARETLGDAKGSIEGVEGTIPVTHTTEDFLAEWCENLRSSVAYYGGCTNWKEFSRVKKFVEITSTGLTESGIRVNSL